FPRLDGGAAYSVKERRCSRVHVTKNDDDRLAKRLSGAGHGKSNSFVFGEAPYLSYFRSRELWFRAGSSPSSLRRAPRCLSTRGTGLPLSSPHRSPRPSLLPPSASPWR